MLKKRLAKLRKELGLTQYEVAEKLGISRGKLANYEQGSRQPDYDMLKELATFYNVTTDYLLGSTDNPDKTEEDDRDKIIHKIATEFPDIDLMFNDLANMDADELKEVYEFIKFKARDK